MSGIAGIVNVDGAPVDEVLLRESLLGTHRDPAGDRRPWSGKMGTPNRARLAVYHFIGYFGITLFFCFAWPRPLLVGGAVMAVAALLECLQALTPDRNFYLPAIFYGAGGALAAALIAEFFIRAWRPHTRLKAAH